MIAGDKSRHGCKHGKHGDSDHGEPRNVLTSVLAAHRTADEHRDINGKDKEEEESDEGRHAERRAVMREGAHRRLGSLGSGFLVVGRLDDPC